MDIIVLLDDSRLTATPSAGVRQALLADQASVQREISREVLGGMPLEVGYSYTTLVNGFSASVTYGQLPGDPGAGGRQVCLHCPLL